MASIEERFRAAVNVIKGLPKNGPYQPSTAMLLTFYGLYKHATEGPCQQKKPAFWDIVGKAKWDSWNGNRYMTKEQAMRKYVDNLRDIIETMSYTTNVQEFVDSIGTYGTGNINLDELEMVAPGMRELAETHPDSPFNSRTNSPRHGVSSNTAIVENAAPPLLNGHVAHANSNVGADGADGTDGVPTPPITPALQLEQPVLVTSTYSPMVDQSDDEYGDAMNVQHDLSEGVVHNTELLKQIQMAVRRMNADVVTVNTRINGLERTVREMRLVLQKSKSNGIMSAPVRNHPKWWPFRNISPLWFALLILWPFVAQRVAHMLVSQRRK